MLSAALTMVIAANTSMVDAIPNITAHLHPTSTETDWMVDAYPLAVASLLLFFGTVGDRYGRRLALAVGLAIFGGASLFGAEATSTNGVIAARALMGVGGAFIMPATLAYIKLLFPPGERKKAFAIWSGSSGVGLVGGPLVAGALMSPIGWQGSFWVNVALCALLLVGAALTVPASRNQAAPRIDIGGALLAIVTLAPLVYATIEASQYGWTSSRVLGAFGVAILGLLAFCAWELRVPSPMLDLGWFRARAFRMGAGLTVLGFTAGVGILYATCELLQQYMFHGALRVGVEMLPMGLGIAAGAVANGQLIRRFGLRWPMVLGLAIAAAGAGVLVGWHTHYDTVAIAIAIMGFGVGIFLPSLTEEVMNGAPHEAGGVAGATADASVELGAAIGVAVIGTIISSRYHSKLPAAIHRLPHKAYQAVHDSLYGAHAVAAKLPASQGHALIHSANHAWLQGFRFAAIVAAGIFATSALLATRLPLQPAEADATDDPQVIDQAALMTFPTDEPDQRAAA
ncbi:MAG: MFS transporter [Solirubrobacterales bacterium]|nr:MFS transporter [Solirubrobacterales bacterium]